MTSIPDRDYYKDVLARMGPHSKYVSPYDTSEAPLPPNMSVGAPATSPPVPPPQQAPVQGGGGSPNTGGNGFGAGPSNIQSPYYVPPPSINPAKAVNESNENVAQIADDRDKHIADQANAMTNAAMDQAAGSEEAAKVQTDLANNLAASNAHDRAAQQMFEQDAQKLANEKHAITDEMSDFYQRQPQDLWGRAGVNKVSGIIGLFMGAFSLNGHNPAMDALNTLVDQRLSQEKFNYQMLGDKAKMNDSLYARLREKLGDDKSAEISARQVYTQETLARLKAVELNTVSKTAKSNLASAIAELQQKNDDYKMALNDHAFSQVAKAAEIANVTRGQDLAHAEHREAMANASQGGQNLPGEINGFDAPQNAGLRLSKAATDKSREEQQGVREVHEVVQDIKTKIAQGGLTSSLEKNQAEAALKLAIVKAHNLSRRVGGDEGKLIEQDAGRLSLGLTGWLTNQIDPGTVVRLMNSLDTSTERAYVKGLVTNGYTVTKGGMYDHSSDASATGQSDDEIVAGMQTRGQKAAMSPQDRIKASIPAYQGQG